MKDCYIAATVNVDADILSPVRSSIFVVRYEGSSMSTTKDCVSLVCEI